MHFQNASQPIYTLAPFEPSSLDASDLDQVDGEWTAPTTLYSLSLTCEPTILQQDTFSTYNSSWGCKFSVGLDGNLTQDADTLGWSSEVKKYSTLYTNTQNRTFATYHIDYCPPDRNHTFYAAFQENKIKEQDPPNNVTAIFCETKYYAQDVNATVDLVTRRPIRTTILGPQRQLTEDIFNMTSFEEQLLWGGSLFQSRGDFLPAKSTPDYTAQLADTEISFSSNSNDMVGLVNTLNKRLLHEYLDWEILSNSYANTYRLLFARAMADVVSSDMTQSKQAEGTTVIRLEAVILEPVFTYIAEGLLAAVSISALILLYLSLTRSVILTNDPNTIASIMSLVAEDQALLANYKDLDCCAERDLKEAVGKRSYKLVEEQDQIW